MKLPHRLNLCRSAREPNGAVIEIFECQAHHVRGQSLRQFTSVLHIQLESMLRQLRLNRMPRAAEFGVNRRFNDHSARRLVRCLGNLENHVAILTVQAHFLQKSSREMEHLQFHSGSGRIEGTRIRLRPAVHRINRNLDGSHHRDGNMFLVMAVFQPQLERRAFADILRLHLARSIVEAAARHHEPSHHK